MKLIAAALFVMASLSVARADIPPPNASQCGGKKTNDACTLDEGGAGHCVETTCSRARPDGEVSYPCTLCEEGAPAGAKTEATPSNATSKGCVGGGAESLLALGGAILLLTRRR